MPTSHPKPHISVCICTFQRPALLAELLEGLGTQVTEDVFTYSAVVVDNDRAESGRSALTSPRIPASLSVEYVVEPRQNIALARNKAIATARGDYVAFIDDDEVPTERWLLLLFRTLHEYKADGVLGPVKPRFDKSAPQWVVEGGFYDRPEHPTGLALDWGKCRTGNVLLGGHLFAGEEPPFRPEFLSGEDQDFFRRAIEQGRKFVWCHEAEAYEFVPPSRWKRGFLVRRALFRGFFSLRNRRSSWRPIAESLVAVPAYAVALPFGLALGQARFMSYTFKLCYFLGRLFALVGINPIKQPYVTE